MDNDGDGLVDFPNEPGCTDTEDNDETDDCPDGPACPACGNAKDDDGDAATDFPNDPGCAAASDDREIDLCLVDVEPLELPFGPTSGQTTGIGRVAISCEEFGGNGAEDIYGIVIDQELKEFTVSSEGSTMDTILAVRKGICDSDEAEVACEDANFRGETLRLLDPEQGTYYLFVDSDFGTGAYQLQVTGTIRGGDPCDPQNTFLACEAGFVCNPGTTTCEVAACNNGGDDDGDGHTDWPNDPGCETISDDDEVDDCPDGPNCPACANGLDDDGDVHIVRDDIGCEAAGDASEKDCDQENDDVAPLEDGEIPSTTSGLSDDSNGTCIGFSQGPERVFSLRVPGKLNNLHLDTIGSDLNTVLYVRGPNNCQGEEIACNDEAPEAPFGQSILDIPDLEAGLYFVFVDGGFAQDFVLNTRGTISGGETCIQEQIDRGVMECEEGFACKVGTCVVTACNTGADEDGDGKTDFPDDPGCENLSDDDEADDCPDGPNCPACANGDDDDADQATDFPDDPGCEFAADNLELDPCAPGTQIVELTDAGDEGTTPPLAVQGNFNGTCNGGTSAEVVYAYEQTRQLSALTFSTEESAGDTVLYARTGECQDEASEVASQNSFGSGESITIQAPDLGTYFVFVDGNFNSSVAYVLDVSGVIDLGGPCDPADETQFACGPGLVCDAGTSLCTATACNNGLDDDGDGKADEADPGCSDIEDTDEAPDPAPLPVCADGVDNDGDGATDFPDDPGCTRASDGAEENCAAATDPVEIFDLQGKTGDTSLANDDFVPSCGFNSTAGDRVYEIVFPGDLDSLVGDTLGSTFDTVLTAIEGGCDGNELSCNDQAHGTNQSEVTVQNASAGLYVFIVDGWSTQQGPYTLNVRAVVKSGEACDPAQVAQGIASCAAGTACVDGTCQ